MPTLENVRRVKAQVEERLMRMPGVTGVSVGYKYVGGRPTDELAIRVHVANKRDVPPAERIPSVLEGVKTDVVERRFVPLHAILPRPALAFRTDTGRYDPLRGGISIGPCRAAIAGTLGVIVNDRSSGNAMMLSNFHVLALDSDFTVGDNIVQPSLVDGGACPVEVVGTLERAVLSGSVDGAVALITDRRNSCRIEEIGAVSGSAAAALDMRVRKRGRTTGLTTGIVDSIDLTTTASYPGIGDIVFTDQIEIAVGEAALSVEPGFFLPVAWSTAQVTTAGPITVTRDTTGSFPGITVTGPTGTVFHATLSNNVSRYMVFGGDNVVLILESTTTAGPVTHRVTLIDFTTPMERLILTGSASSAAVQLPVVQRSQGSGSVFLIYSSNGTQIQNLAMHRSRNGTVVCAGPPPFIPTGETRGQATDTSLLIHFSSGGTSHTIPCPLVPGGTAEAFAQAGDSGSIVVDENRQAVGLLFASTLDGSYATANPIDRVLDALDVRLCRAGGGSGGGGGGGGTHPRLTLSVLALAGTCLGRVPPLSLRSDIFDDASDPVLSLKTRLFEIRDAC